ncbi:protein arginine N-methyltransferase 5-like [Nilaparvata lugens]|uniref:protein arginine N-methyltransferase 5-like n=1 Tax=Nilaparvata lugens TaxID=108931 RepID=UPI00193D3834|nr:protein arginine N-methyltransferase 5-like [Nilaparvata lugens]
MESKSHEDITRYKVLEFNVKSKCILHGFAGYFHTLLYGDIVLSTIPDNHTSGLFTWFPIYFPIQNPVELKAGDKVELHFWRLVNKEKMWYEWSICKPKFTPIHNLNGIGYSAKLR